jgi:hypothetical protein
VATVCVVVQVKVAWWPMVSNSYVVNASVRTLLLRVARWQMAAFLPEHVKNLATSPTIMQFVHFLARASGDGGLSFLRRTVHLVAQQLETRLVSALTTSPSAAQPSPQGPLPLQAKSSPLVVRVLMMKRFMTNQQGALVTSRSVRDSSSDESFMRELGEGLGVSTFSPAGCDCQRRCMCCRSV